MAALTPDQQRSVSESGGYYDVDGNWIDLTEGGPPNPPPRPPTTGAPRQPQQGSGVNPWLGILTTLGAIGGGAYLRNRSANNNVPPELRQLLQMSMDRQAYQNPLFQAATQGAYQMLPNFARDGTQLSGNLSNTPPPAPSGSGGSGGPGSGGANNNPLTSLNPLKNPLLAGLLGALGGSALGSGGSGGNIPFKDIVDGLKRLFGGNPDNPNNWPLRPGTGFGGTHTSTYGSRDPFGTNLPGLDLWGFFNDPRVFTGLPNDPSGGTGIGPGMAGYRDNPYNPFLDPNFNGMPDFNGYPDPNFGNPDFLGPSDPSGGSGIGPGMASFYNGGGSFPVLADPSEE